MAFYPNPKCRYPKGMLEQAVVQDMERRLSELEELFRVRIQTLESQILNLGGKISKIEQG